MVTCKALSNTTKPPQPSTQATLKTSSKSPSHCASLCLFIVFFQSLSLVVFHCIKSKMETFIERRIARFPRSYTIRCRSSVSTTQTTHSTLMRMHKQALSTYDHAESISDGDWVANHLNNSNIFFTFFFIFYFFFSNFEFFQCSDYKETSLKSLKVVHLHPTRFMH